MFEGIDTRYRTGILDYEISMFQSAKEVSKKPVRVRPPREWGEDEIEELRRLYEENKEAMDPVGRIIDHMTVKRPKKRIVDKIIGKIGYCVHIFVTKHTYFVTLPYFRIGSVRQSCAVEKEENATFRKRRDPQ